MIKGISTTRSILVIDASDIGALKYIANNKRHKGEIGNNTITVGTLTSHLHLGTDHSDKRI